MTVAARREAKEINATDASACQTIFNGNLMISPWDAKMGELLQRRGVPTVSWIAPSSMRSCPDGAA
jgi:hypothetical protein